MMELRRANLPGLLQRCMYIAQGSFPSYINSVRSGRHLRYGDHATFRSISAIHPNTASCNKPSSACLSERTVHQVFSNTLLTRTAWSSSGISIRDFNTSMSLNDMQGSRKEAQSSQVGHKDVFPPDRGMNMLVAVENDYLSWMRNTYISTLASLTMLNFEPIAGSAITATIGLTIAGMNVLVGSCGYMLNLSNMKQRGYVRWYRCRIYQTIALVHLVLWYCILVLLIPDWHMVEEDINRVEGELTHGEGDVGRAQDGAKEPTK